MAWQCLAAHTGGTVAALATDSAGDGMVVFAATPVGVFSSDAAGSSWSLASATHTVPFAEALDVGSAGSMFAGARDGLYRSSDGGVTWQRVLVGGSVFGVASAPSGVVVAATEQDGVLRSEDNGHTWNGANAGLLDLTALTLALSPCFDQDRVGFVGTASGLFRTRNGARSWRAVESGFDDDAVQCLAISSDFAVDRLVLAGTESSGLLRSDDGGSSWRQALGGSVTAVAFSGQRIVAAATDSGVAASDDGAQTWRMMGQPPGDILSLVFVGEALLAGLDRLGVARSVDGGATWQFANAGLIARVATALAVATDGTLFEASIEDGIRSSTDGGRTWHSCTSGLNDAPVLGLATSPAYADDRTLYAATSAGIHVSRDGGSTWQLANAASAPARSVAAGPSLVLAASSGGTLHASEDSGRTWRELERALEGEIVSIANAHERPLFVASNSEAGVVLWRSVDAGKSWQRWLVESGTDFLSLAVAPTYSIDETVFVGSGSRVLKPRRQSREVRAGGSETRPLWRAAELEGAAAVTALAVSPRFATDRTVAAGTNAGVFVSRTGGDTFVPWSQGLRPAGVMSMAFAPDGTLYALGLGGTLWRRHLTDG